MSLKDQSWLSRLSTRHNDGNLENIHHATNEDNHQTIDGEPFEVNGSCKQILPEDLKKKCISTKFMLCLVNILNAMLKIINIEQAGFKLRYKLLSTIKTKQYFPTDMLTG